MFPATGYAAAGGRLSEPPLRSVFMFVPNGVYPKDFTPAGDGEDYEITPMLQSLAPMKKEFMLLEKLWNEKTVGRNGHWPKVPAYLSGGFVKRTSGKDMDVGGLSLDQYFAREIGDRTPLPSLELGIDPARTGVDNVGGGFTRIYGSHIAWRDRHTPVPKEIVPQLAFDRLFRTTSLGPVISGLNPNSPEVVKSLQRDDTSLLDLVLEDAKRIRRQVSSTDQVKLDEYLESVRSVERRIEASMKPQKRWINEGRFDVPRPGPGIPKEHQDHVELMLDILLLALWTDSTRVATFMFGDAQSGKNYSFLDGVNGSFHGLSHHREKEEPLKMYKKIVTWNIDRFAAFLEKMHSLDEAGSSLLDNSMVLYGSTIKDGNRHTEKDLPLILAGRGKGTLKPGRRIRQKEDTPLCNLFVSMAHRMGLAVDSFGDSTGPLDGLS